VSQAAIRFENLGKEYIIARTRQHRTTMSESMINSLKSSARLFSSSRRQSHRAAMKESVWALRGASLEIGEGEVLGLIGHNGAGKSTLLKILSRITEPTEGFAEIRGRVGSLLEVGSGFHPELTGRENIFLNGAILGMRKQEIENKFDEIVDFAEVERFIETPVKKYSSGMRMRLAFAVAAHLDPEVMLVDEVLAVGDANFQRKCLGKMSDVARGGRTVIFVSHNMAAVESLCQAVVWLDQGRIRERSDDPAGTIRAYLNEGYSEGSSSGTMAGRVVNRAWITVEGEEASVCRTGDDIAINIQVALPAPVSSPRFRFEIFNGRGLRVATMDSRVEGGLDLVGGSLDDGNYLLSCTIPDMPLVPDEYFITVTILSGKEPVESLPNLLRFDISEGDFYRSGRPPRTWHGVVALKSDWDLSSRVSERI
jgi:lipopolysaccharide transport system ATP-binding protein